MLPESQPEIGEGQGPIRFELNLLDNNTTVCSLTSFHVNAEMRAGL